MSDNNDSTDENRTEEESLEKSRVADVSTFDPRESGSGDPEDCVEDSAEGSAEDSEE